MARSESVSLDSLPTPLAHPIETIIGRADGHLDVEQIDARHTESCHPELQRSGSS